MKVGHVRERHAPAGTAWRLAVGLGEDEKPDGWLDVEVARRRLLRGDPRREHNSVLFRNQVTTLDDHLGRGLRVGALAEIVEAYELREDDDAALDPTDLVFGPPLLRPLSLRDFYAFEGHVATMWRRRQQDVPEAWYRLPIFYFSNVSEIRGPDDPVWAPAGSEELDYELEVCAVVDTPALNVSGERGEETIGGYTILNDWSARDLQREETTVRLGPAKGKDFASTIGPWLVTPDELADAQDGKGYRLSMSAEVNGQETSRGMWSEAHFSFGEMIARASADARLRAGDVIGSGTVGTGCLLEVKDERLGRYLQPEDEVVLRVDRLGELRTPVIGRPEER
jgi:fumarylacetoacetate (FAA) hydrolase